MRRPQTRPVEEDGNGRTSITWRPFIRRTKDTAALLAGYEVNAITYEPGEASPMHTHPEDDCPPAAKGK